MSYKKYIIPVFVVVALIQLAVPFKMIWDKEAVFSKGKAFKFKTAPIDPNDPFRGKYIYLNYDNQLTTYYTNDTTFKNIKDVYITFDTDASGYASIRQVSKTKPQNTPYYLKTQANFVTYNKKSHIRISYPFDRFYMEEYKAPQAEQIYRKEQNQPNTDCYAKVYIYQGQAALRDVIVNGKSVKELGSL